MLCLGKPIGTPGVEVNAPTKVCFIQIAAV